MSLDHPLSEQFDRALEYASRLHRTQSRKGTQVPYVAHLLGTASIALEHGANEAEAIAALLHDAIEDQGGERTREEIHEIFGKEVADIVEGCTDADQDPKPPWVARKTAYVAHLRDASRSVRLVSASDKLYNARAILTDFRRVGEDLWSRFSERKFRVLWYYAALVDAFRAAGDSPLVDELDAVVKQLIAEAAGSDHRGLACKVCGSRMTAEWAPFCSASCDGRQTATQTEP